MSVVSAQHAHTPTGPFEHGSSRAQDAVATAPSRDSDAARGASTKSDTAHSNRDHTKHTNNRPADRGRAHHAQPTAQAQPTQQDIPTAGGDARVEVRDRVQIAREAWDKFNHPVADRGLLI